MHCMLAKSLTFSYDTYINAHVTLNSDTGAANGQTGSWESPRNVGGIITGAAGSRRGR